MFNHLQTSTDRKYSFTGHETFPFRYTWLPKGVQKLEEYPDLFLREDAPVILGVGKNMVRSIRHWCEATGLISSPKRGIFEATSLGKSLFGPTGWDPYLENPGTLWILHWKLVSSWERSSTWYLAFTRWGVTEFSRNQLVEWLIKIIEEESLSTRATKNSIKRDVDVFLRTYIPSKVTATRPLEDTFDCPLLELGLISEIDRDLFILNQGYQHSLSKEVFIFALYEYWDETSNDRKTISFERILYGGGSPGRAFNLSENALYDRLQHLEDYPELIYDDTAGMRNIIRGNKGSSPFSILARYYEDSRPVN